MKANIWGALAPFFFTSYSAWPTVAIDANHTLYVAYSGNRKRHVDPYGVNLLIKSYDFGKTWTEPTVVYDSPLDDRDAGLLVLQDGTLLYSTFSSNYFKTALPFMIEHYGKEVEKEWEEELKTEEIPQSSILLSHDQGETFEGPYHLPVSTPHGPIQAKDGTLLYLGNRLDNGMLELYESQDGKSWTLRSTLYHSKFMPEWTFCEPYMIQMTDHSFLAFFRANHPDKKERYLFSAWSMDDGRSWSNPEKTDIYGCPPHFLRLSNGEIVLTYADRRFPYTIRAKKSLDGKTWSRARILAFGWGSDIGYPSTVELPDGSLFTVFYNQNVLQSKRWR